MMPQASGNTPIVRLGEFVHKNRAGILAAWTRRLARLPAFDGESLVTQRGRVLDWLTDALGAADHAGTAAQISSVLPLDPQFSGPRAVAELALLSETIDQFEPAPMDDALRDALHRVIDAAIAHSLSRAGDDSDRMRKRLQLATDITSVGAWELEPVSGVVGTDARARELFLVVDDEPATLEALTSRVYPEDRERVRDGIANMLASGRPYADECRAARADDGSLRWIAIAAEAHQAAYAHGPTVIGIVHDVTEVKRAEEEHARVVEELSRAVHISEMFVGILSHDLRNPLSAILGGAQLLAMDAKDEKATRILKLVASSGQRMGRMIDQLLDFTRARLGEGISLERATVDLAILARDVVEEGKTGNVSSLLRHTACGDTKGNWDHDRLNQILSNLVGNAMQHGRSDGSIEVTVDGREPDRVKLSVRSGVIAPELLPVLFNPFRGTLEKRGKSRGLGLGLYVARQIALAHGGDLEVAAIDGCSVFTLTLPRTGAASAPPRTEVVREEELAAFERMAAQPNVSAVTAQLFGATPLVARAPLEHANLVERYLALLEVALQRRAYRVEGDGLSDDLRALAERLGDLGAGPREVTDVHAQGLRRALRGATAAKTQALLAEGRLLALELMGNLASYYRRRARGQTRAPAGGRAQP